MLRQTDASNASSDVDLGGLIAELNLLDISKDGEAQVSMTAKQFIDFDYGKDTSDISTIPDDMITQILKEEGLETEELEMEISNEISAENMEVAESFFKLYAAGVFDGMRFEERLRSIENSRGNL
ncbi:hypothetical protein HK098_008230 [Nowakowskiella sp. JEL0407]|nr:hypothetical protein HK098_008230 [Nowakowskiella sp. JEL0407]